MQFQTLERRRLCSVTVNETFPGYYEIVSDGDADGIVVAVDQAARTFELDGSTFYNVAYITVYGNGGDDAIDVHSDTGGPIGATIDAGDGNDDVSLNFDGAIYAGAGNDTLNLADSFQGQVFGQAGDDRVSVRGECIDAEISGGDGNDLIDATANNDGVVLRGGDGDDTIYGSAFDDQVYGDGGEDVLFGLGGNDTFFCRDASADEIHGGAGTDFLYADSLDGPLDGVEYTFMA